MEEGFTLQVEHQQLPARVLVGPVAEGQHGLFQQVGGVDLLAVVVVELAELPGDALLDGEPLTGRVTVEQEHLQKPEHRRAGVTTAETKFTKHSCVQGKWEGFFSFISINSTLKKDNPN